MSGTPPPLPVLTEDDIDALPPAPSSSFSSTSPSTSSAIDTAADEHITDVSTPVDAPLNHSDNEQADEEEDKQSEEEADTSAVEISDAQAPVDTPLAMLDLLPPPPSSSSASPWSTSSSPFYPATLSPIVDAPLAGEADTPTVVDSASELQEEDVGKGSAQQAHPSSLEHEPAEQRLTDDVIAGEEGNNSNAFSEEAVAESLRLSDERAAAALDRFVKSLHAKLVEQLIDDAAIAVEETLHSTIRQYGTRVQALVAQNAALDTQLASQAARMQAMQRELEESVVRDVQRMLRVDLSAAFRAHGQTSTSSSSSVAPREERDEEKLTREGEESPIEAHHDVMASAGTPVSVDELTAAYLGTRSTIEVLQREREEWRRQTSSLQTTLLAAIKENAVLRREVERLRTTTVDLETHRAVREAREEAEHQCELLRLQLAKQVEEAETLVALVERQELTRQQQTHTDAPTPAATTKQNDNGEDAVRAGPVWDMAMRELEEQATIAANSCHLHEQLATAEAEVKRLKAERDASVAYAAALQKEGDVLRADAQSLVYRNGVLSQQVASLLVKVEKTTRAYRHLKDDNSSKQQQQQHDRTLEPSTLLKSLPSTSSRRSNWLASMWPAKNASRSTAITPDATITLQQSAEYASGVGKSLNTAVLYDSPSSPDIQQLLYMPGASADVSFMQAPMEVEEGVQQRLSTYSSSHVAVPSALLSAASTSSAQHSHLSRRSRQTSLRQLGSATLEVDLACMPRLPASDKLSGSALGHPSAYSTLDPLNGTVTRRVGTAEISVRWNGDGRASRSTAAASPSSLIASEDDINKDPQLLCLLDTLDKDESLDRFSVNSVSELVVRNQELVKQLYDATQRAEAAEKQQQQKNSSEMERRCSSTASASEGIRELPVSLTTPPAALLQHAEPSAGLQRRSAVIMSSRKRDREDGAHLSDAEATNAQEQVRGSVGLVQSENAADSDASSSNVSGSSQEQEKTVMGDVDPVATVEPWFLESVSEAVTSMVDALVRRHGVRLTAVDTDVSRALLRALAAQREADHAVQTHTTQHHTSDSVGSFVATVASSGESGGGAPVCAMAVCLRSLLQLCVRQSATLAEAALNAAGQQHEMQRAVKETWTEVQETLVRALQTAQKALVSSQNTSSGSVETLVSSSLQPSPLQRTRSETANASASAVMMTTVTDHDTKAGPLTPQRNDDVFREEDVALLQELRSLLWTAAKKDGMLLHVYQAAQARQEARQRQQKERMTRLLLKLERKRRLIKALRLRQANTGVDVAARGLSHTGQDADTNSTTQNAAATFRLSPQPGSPVYRTPPMLPMSLPAATALGSPQPQQHPTLIGRTRIEKGDLDAHTDRASSAQSNKSEAESEDDVDDDAMTLDIFRELQQQLAFSQATHRAVQEELDAEKQKHTTMLERMWVLETARDDAAAAKETLEKRLQQMVPRDTYESLAEDLKKATDELSNRETQLSDALTERTGLKEKIAALQAQLEAQQLQSKAQRGQLEEVARRLEQRLVTEEGRYRELHTKTSDVTQHAAGLENITALLRRELQEKEQAIAQRDATIVELKSQTLMRDDVQALVRHLYPDDSVVQANAQLVQRLSQTTTRLEVELAEARQDLAHAQAQLRQFEVTVREAVQDRQSAEVRLQDAVARLVQLRDIESGHSDNNEENQYDSVSPLESPNIATSPSLMSIDALLNVEGVSVAALRHRVRYLTARMEAQTKDLAVMRDAEAAWKSREENLRRQLELMSADPISLTARKYGLKACANFLGQMAEMQTRQDALRDKLTVAEERIKALKDQLETAAKKETETERQRVDAMSKVRQVEEQLAAIEAESEDRKATIAVLEAQQREATAKHDDLLRQHQQTLSDLHDKTAALDEVQASLETCRAQRDQFLTDNKQMISAVEKLEKALLQSEAEKEMAREALTQGLSSSSASHRRRGGGGNRGTAAERYQQQTSLTQDLSLSSTTPNY